LIIYAFDKIRDRNFDLLDLTQVG